MRIKVMKYLFMGARLDKEAFFAAAQNLGIIEFISPQGIKRVSYPQEVEKLADAIKVLRGYVQETQEQKKDLSRADTIATRILVLKASKESAEEKKREVEQEILRIAPFGNFSFDELQKTEEELHRTIRFFCAKTSKHLDDLEEALILINSLDGIDYFIALQNEPLIHADLLELHFTESLGTLERKREEFISQIEQGENELKSLTRYNWLLHQALLHRLNEANLVHAKNCSEFELENQLFCVEGWVPQSDGAKLKKLCIEHTIYTEEVAIDTHEVAPTCLENKGPAKVGEDLVRIFDTPSNKDKDPSLWVLFAFSLFFSMIVYDGGYGLLFLATAMYLHFKFRKVKSVDNRLIALLATLAISCTLWGSLTHSYFGIELSRDSFLRKHSLMTWLTKKKAAYHMAQKDDVYRSYVAKYPQLANCKSPEDFIYAHNETDTSETPIANKLADNILMELALFLGCVHICLGLLRYLSYNPVGAGWIAFIIGAYLYVPSYLHTPSFTQYIFGIPQQHAAEFGLHLLFFGLGLAMLIGMILHGIAGLFEFMHSIQIFADVLSYLRIYALGLAGFIVSEQVNHLASKMPLLLAIGLLIAGHFLNILLSVMGGTIHGLRLNFLEWYRYSFYGGGKDFQPLRLQTLE